ncbi:TPM domain-containing protein [Anaeromyxobacter sp. Red801]|uniref:TPM domain-containing protein n=1 Tax=Anaeromyxobacter sp. Red801 TaxID=3411632 RepID=UPI003B9FD5F0
MKLELQFDEAARRRIAEAVGRAEALSRGQIVPVVVEKSDPYPEVRYRGALLAAAIASAAVLALHLPVTLAELPLVQLAAGLLGAWLSMWDPVERRLAGARALDQAVRARAVRAFHENGLHRTAEGTGVLVFASLFEREAVILGDRGIHEKMGDAGWDRAVAALVAGMRAGEPGRGFVEAIAQCGARLAEHFPRDPAARPPPNELEDAIRASRT